MGGLTILGVGKYPVIGGGGAATTWNPSDKAANITLSGSNLIATGAASSYASVRGTNSKSSGKFYFEVLVSALPFEAMAIGIGTSAATLTAMTGAGTTSWGYVNAGSVYNNNTTIEPAAPNSYANGAVIGVAVDKDNHRLYFAENNTWNFTGDPVAGTGGFDISGVSGSAVFPMFTGMTGDQGTARFSTGNTYSPPTGYSLWG